MRRGARPATSPRTRRRRPPRGPRAPDPRAQRRVPQEQPRLGVHEGRRAAMGDGDTLGSAGRPRGEDDPRVIRRAGPPGPAPLGATGRTPMRRPLSDDGAHPGLRPHGLGALVRIVDVNRHIRRPDGQDREDRNVQLSGARGDPHADPVTPADAHPGETAAHLVQPTDQPRVGEHLTAVINRPSMGESPGGGFQDVEQGARRGRRTGRIHRERRPCCPSPQNGERNRRVHYSPSSHNARSDTTVAPIRRSTATTNGEQRFFMLRTTETRGASQPCRGYESKGSNVTASGKRLARESERPHRCGRRQTAREVGAIVEI